MKTKKIRVIPVVVIGWNRYATVDGACDGYSNSICEKFWERRYKKTGINPYIDTEWYRWYITRLRPTTRRRSRPIFEKALLHESQYKYFESDQGK